MKEMNRETTSRWLSDKVTQHGYDQKAVMERAAKFGIQSPEEFMAILDTPEFAELAKRVIEEHKNGSVKRTFKDSWLQRKLNSYSPEGQQEQAILDKAYLNNDGARSARELLIMMETEEFKNIVRNHRGAVGRVMTANQQQEVNVAPQLQKLFEHLQAAEQGIPDSVTSLNTAAVKLLNGQHGDLNIQVIKDSAMPENEDWPIKGRLIISKEKGGVIEFGKKENNVVLYVYSR